MAAALGGAENRLVVAYWICAAFTLISSCVSLGYSLSAVTGSGSGHAGPAEYTLARSVALAAVAVVPLFGERRDWLIAATIAMIIVQTADGVIGARLRDRLKTVGPVITAAVNLVVLIWYLSR